MRDYPDTSGDPPRDFPDTRDRAVLDSWARSLMDHHLGYEVEWIAGKVRYFNRHLRAALLREAARRLQAAPTRSTVSRMTAELDSNERLHRADLPIHVRGAHHETVQTYAAHCSRCGDSSPVSRLYDDVRRWRDEHERERHDMSHRRTVTGVFEARCSCGSVSPALEQYADVGRWQAEHEQEMVSKLEASSRWAEQYGFPSREMHPPARSAQ